MPTYHALHIETADIPRTSISNLPYGMYIRCCRVAGWELWRYDYQTNDHVLVAGEFAKNGMRLDVDCKVIVDSLTEKLEEEKLSAS